MTRNESTGEAPPMFLGRSRGSFILRGICGAFVIAHVAALIYAALLTTLMRGWLGERIEAERATAATA